MAPENTLAAFRRALHLGVDGIELDVHMTRDGRIVAIHDSTVDRTTDGRGKVGALGLAALQALDAGSWFNRKFPTKARPEYAGERIPTLDEVMSLVGGRAHLFIELKDPDLYPDNLESELLAAVRHHGIETRVTFLSFNVESLRMMRSLDSSIALGLLAHSNAGDACREAASLQAQALGVLFRLLTPEFLHEARQCGLKVLAWTVDEPADIKRVAQAGVDAIISNYPDRALGLLR